jgi:hypothetical protein
MRWMTWTACMAALTVVAVSGCRKEKKVVIIVPQSDAAVSQAPTAAEPTPAPPPAPASEMPANEEASPASQTPANEPAAPVYQSPAPQPVVVAPAPPPPVVVAPAPVVVEPIVVQPATTVSISFFHEKLRHHGRWVTVATYGQVWVPAGVPVGWRPYTLGHWVYTEDYGWTWVSDEPFGWATYHYGRWAWVDGYGWVWLPGTVWGPAWVVWRTGGGYVGWAPMPPAAVVAPVVERHAEVSININIGVVNRIHPHHWVFVEERHLMEPVHKHIVVSKRNDWIVNVTRPSTHIVVSHGRLINRSLAVRDVERATGKRVPAMRVRDVDAAAETRTVVKGNEVLLPRVTVRPISRTRTGAAAAADTGAATGGPAVVSPPASTAGKPVMRQSTVVTTPRSADTGKVGGGPANINAGGSPSATIKSAPVTTKSTRTDVERKVRRDAGALPVSRSVARPVGTTQVPPSVGPNNSGATGSELSTNTTVRKAVVDPPPATDIKVRSPAVVTPPTVKKSVGAVHKDADVPAAAPQALSPQSTSAGTIRRVDISRQGPPASENRDLKVDRAVVRRARTGVQAPTAAAHSPGPAQAGGQTQTGADLSTSVKRTVSPNPSGPDSPGSVKVRTDVRRDRMKSTAEKRTDRNEAAPE